MPKHNLRIRTKLLTICPWKLPFFISKNELSPPTFSLKAKFLWKSKAIFLEEDIQGKWQCIFLRIHGQMKVTVYSCWIQLWVGEICKEKFSIIFCLCIKKNSDNFHWFIACSSTWVWGFSPDCFAFDLFSTTYSWCQKLDRQSCVQDRLDPWTFSFETHPWDLKRKNVIRKLNGKDYFFLEHKSKMSPNLFVN